MVSIFPAAIPAAIAVVTLIGVAFTTVRRQARARRGAAGNCPESLTPASLAEKLILDRVSLDLWPEEEWSEVIAEVLRDREAES